MLGILPNTVALESSRSNRVNVSSRLRKVRAPPLTSVNPIEDDSVIARLVQHVVSLFLLPFLVLLGKIFPPPPPPLLLRILLTIIINESLLYRHRSVLLLDFL